MAQTSARWTISDLDRLPDDGNRYELVRGELFVTPAPSFAHESIASALRARIEPYVLAHRIGRVFGPRAVIRIGESQLEPDLMVLPRTARVPESWDSAPLPLLVVEILSDATRRRDTGSKRTFYANEGIPEYWIVDGDARAVRVVRTGSNDVVTSGMLPWQPAPSVAALTIDLPALFREALG